MPNVQHKRGTRAALDALAGSSGLIVGQIYIITDESRIAVATSSSAYEAFEKEGEGSGPAGADGTNVTITVAANQTAYDAATPSATELVVLYSA